MNRVAVSVTSQISAKLSSRRARIRCGFDRPSAPTTRASRASGGNSTTIAAATTMASGASTSRRTSLGGTMTSSSSARRSARPRPAQWPASWAR